MLQEVRRVDTSTNQDMIRYRRESERHAGSDEHLYRVEWVSWTNSTWPWRAAASHYGPDQDAQGKKMYIQLLDGEDPSIEGDRTAIGRWREYLDSYVLSQPTEWVPLQKKGRRSPLFLRR